MQTMQELYQPKAYPPDVLSKLRKMSPLAISIANRWMLGWPKMVRSLLETDEYLPALQNQEKEEREALSNPGNAHLAQHEIALEYGLTLAPPAPSNPS